MQSGTPYNSAAGDTIDNSTDPGAQNINPAKYLANDIGKSGIVRVLIIVLFAFAVIHFSKKIF
jgi:hypothetical protein